MSPLAVTTWRISSACPECGTVRKSGKASCCGRGGSWFRNCGSAGDANFGHTWQEGIWACKTRRSQAVTGRRRYHSQVKNNASSHIASVDIHSKAIILVTHMSVSEPANTSTQMQGVTPIMVPAYTPSITPDSDSMTYNPSTTIPKAGVATSATIIRTLANISILKASSHQVTPRATPTITAQVNARIIPIVNLAIIKPMRSALADISTTTSPQESDSASIIVRELKQSPCVVIYISMMFILFCWH